MYDKSHSMCIHFSLKKGSCSLLFNIIVNIYTVCVIKVKQSHYRPGGARRGPDGSRKLRLPDFVTTAQDGGKVVSLTHRPPLPPGNTPGTHFC